MHWYIDPIKKYAVFKGRASRKEYWMFYLFNFIVMLILSFISSFMGLYDSEGNGLLTSGYQFIVVLPSLAISVRRMHDVDKSGWWILFPLVNFILTITEGTEGENKYGQDPYSIVMVELA